MTTTEEAMEVLEQVGKDYRLRMESVLTAIKTEIESRGLNVSEILDFTGDEFMLVIQVDPTEDQDDSIVIEFRIDEAWSFGDTEPFDGHGLNFSINIVEYGGMILGGLQPYNYTPQVWVDARQPREVERRFRIFQEPDIAEQAADLIQDHLAAKERQG